MSVFLLVSKAEFLFINVLPSRRHVDIWGDRNRDWVVLGNEIAALLFALARLWMSLSVSLALFVFVCC